MWDLEAEIVALEIGRSCEKNLVAYFSGLSGRFCRLLSRMQK